MDIILSGGMLIDGTGKAAEKGDLRISGQKIAWTGDGPREGAQTVDVSGLTVTPGFIDFHSHTDMSLLVNPTSESKLTQGITLEVNGNCGASDSPVLDTEARKHVDESFRRMGTSLSWDNVGSMLDVLERSGTAVNFCTLAGLGNVRREVVGAEDRPATEDEIRRMQDLVARSMDEGAVGVSSGLIYPPGCYASPGELARVCEPVGKRGGIYATHMRSESDKIVEAVRESIHVGEHSGAKVEVSHLKACGTTCFGKAVDALEEIQRARARGVDVSADQYPYIATATGLETMIPAWAHSGGEEALRSRLNDPAARAKIKAELERDLAPGGAIADSGGFETVVISSVRTDANRWAEGMNMAQIAARMGQEPVEALFNFLLAEDFGVGMIHFCLSEKDVEAVMGADFTLFGCDATARALSGPMSAGKPHPRAWGTFPRVLAEYVRKRRVLSLEQAVCKMTSVAADRLGMSSRGRLKAGCYADIVVLNPATVEDTATFTQPKQPAAGIMHVLVNGEFALRDGKITGKLPGAVLRGTGA